MDISDELIEKAKMQPMDALFIVADDIESMVEEVREWTEEELEALTIASAFISTMVDANLLTKLVAMPSMSGNLSDDCKNLLDYVETFDSFYRTEASKQRVDSFRSKFGAAFGTAFSYHFTDGDVSRIQTLINELRELVSKSNDFDSDHKARLLKRLERLQSEIHKHVSDLDRFWGLIGDAGVVIGKLGKDAKPIVDRIREVTDIIWRTQSNTEQLPTGTPTPMLKDPTEIEQRD